VKFKQVIVTQYGGPEVLQVVEDELREPPSHTVRVRILAAGVSYADALIREGIHPETRRPPFVPGWDFVGIVDRHGQGVTAPPIGQMVAALPVVGSYAQYICLDPKELVLVPDGLVPAVAVSLVLNTTTAYQMLHRTAHTANGQSVLIHSAGGGVGTALLQLGALMGLDDVWHSIRRET
jgi:NADPH2:quinone reductase